MDGEATDSRRAIVMLLSGELVLLIIDLVLRQRIGIRR